MLEGKKTMTGGILLIIAGAVFIGGLYDAMFYEIGKGVAMMGAGLIAIGLHNCVARIWFNRHDGKIMHNSSRIQPPSLTGGE
ncbi:hypothetical protein LCGC14_2636740 [marine sediment metagenome]|uniref:Uncharacterized protein n=1 Tax=marine sediment metagenome TaxID=412755 RepID=A0A0F9C9J8_9ZZZZ